MSLDYAFLGTIPPGWEDAGVGFVTLDGLVDVLNVTLAPGEVRRVVFSVATPIGVLDPNFVFEFDLAVRVRSLFDPASADRFELRFVHSTTIHPDIAIEEFTVDTKPSALTGREAVFEGVPTLLTTLIANRGTKDAEDVDVTLTVIAPSGARTTVLGPTLLPVTRIGLLQAEGGAQPIPFQWTPRETGLHTVVLEARLASGESEVTLANNRVVLPVRVEPLPLPDLELSALRLLDAKGDPIGEEGPVDGTVVTVLARLTNVGHAPASGINVEFFARKDRFWVEKLPTIGAGESVELRAPWRVALGADEEPTKTIRIFTYLSGGGLFELNLDNNEVTRPVFVRTFDPRLVVVEAEADAVRGGAVTFGLVVGAGGNSEDRIALVVEGLPAGWQAIALPERVLPVAAGTNVTAEILVRLPERAFAGPWPFSVVARSTIAPAAEERAIVTTHVARETGFALEAEDALAIEPGTTLVPVTVRNLGNGLADVATLEVVLRPANWTAAFNRSRLVLDGFASRVVELNLTTPPGRETPPGTHRIVLAGELSGIAVQREIAIEVVAAPRAAMALTGLPERVRPGEQLSATLAVENVGNVPARFVLAASSPIALARLGAPEVTLEPGERVEIALDLTLVLDAEPGPHLLVIEATTGERRFTITRELVVAAAELAFAAGEVRPREARPGDNVLVVVKVENRADVAVSNASLATYVDGVLVDYRRLALDARASEELGIVVRASEGRSAVSVLLDEENHVLEVHEDNNGLELTLQSRVGDFLGVRVPGFEPVAAALAAIAIALWARRRPG